MKLHRHRKVYPLLNMAPLIDCVFLLLIFFLLTSSFMEESGLQINLPESALAAAPTAEENRIVISLMETGLVELNGKPVILENLKTELTRLIPVSSERPKKQVVLRADKNTRLNLVIEVIDGIKSAGFNSVDIKTATKEKGIRDE